MTETRQRRSCRLALRLPIRVFGIDFKGTDFVEDSTTVVVNLHGAKIRLARRLVPEQEVRILSGRTGQEAVFRVVSWLEESESQRVFWGVECLNPGQNIWGVSFPVLGPKDQSSARVMLQCPECRTRELLNLDEPLLESMHAVGGLRRLCLACGRSALWQQVPYYEA